MEGLSLTLFVYSLFISLSVFEFSSADNYLINSNQSMLTGRLWFLQLQVSNSVSFPQVDPLTAIWEYGTGVSHKSSYGS